MYCPRFDLKRLKDLVEKSARHLQVPQLLFEEQRTHLI